MFDLLFFTYLRIHKTIKFILRSTQELRGIVCELASLVTI